MVCVLIAVLLATAPSEAQKFEGLALTPPMGWNTWNYFGCEFDEQLIREIADAMVSTGMRDAGYVYLNLDNCWQSRNRDSEGRLREDPGRFPSGMKALADYIHGLGLKFGIYSDAGPFTCGGHWPGSAEREYEDAATFAEWGVDYLKYDWCYSDGLDAEAAYGAMASALVDAGRPVVFSICEWGLNEPWKWGKPMGHLWRISGDITTCFDCVIDHGGFQTLGVMHIMDKVAPLRKWAGPGHWNDPDMLQVGNGLSTSENRAHFSMWSMLAAPLIAGNDIRNMSDETREILTNTEVIAVNQDPLGIQGFRYSQDDGLEIWFKPLVSGDWAMAVLNRSDDSRTFSFDWRNERVVDTLTYRETGFSEVRYRISDLWKAQERGTTDDPILAEVPRHDVMMLRLSPVAGLEHPSQSGWDFRLYPNPATSITRIQIRARSSGRVVFTIFDALGRFVSRPMEKELTTGLYSFDLLLGDLPSGTYYVQSSSKEGTVVRSLSIVH